MQNEVYMNNCMKNYTTPLIKLIPLLLSDVITTSTWQLPELPMGGAPATDAGEAQGLATNY